MEQKAYIKDRIQTQEEDRRREKTIDKQISRYSKYNEH